MDTKLLKQKILDLAIRGKLVPQNPADEPASVLLERIKAEKAQLIKEGKIKKIKITNNEEDRFVIPTNWEWCKLSDIASFSGGKTPSTENELFWKEGKHLWVTSKDMKLDLINDSQLKISDYALNDLQLHDPKTILIVVRSGILRRMLPVAILDEYATINQDLKAISLICKACSNFLFYYIKGREKYILEKFQKDGTTVESINFEKMQNMLVPLPPLAEQKRIVAEIDRWFKCIDELEKNQQDLHTAIQQAKSKILDLAIHGKLVPQESEWKECTISELCENINGLWKGKKEPFINVGVIRNANFTKDFKLDYSKIEYIDVEEKSFKKRHLINGDLIVEKSGGSDQNPVGRAILYEGPDEKFSYSNFTMVLRINNAGILFYKYLYYFILNRYKCGDMKQMQTQTTGLHNLILDKYLAINVPLPQISEQKCIVSKIEELFTQLDKIEESLN